MAFTFIARLLVGLDAVVEKVLPVEALAAKP